MGVGANAIRTDRQIVTLCGSMRFWGQMVEVAKVMTMDGAVVLAPFVDVSILDDEAEGTHRKKKQLDDLHMDKIAMSTRVIVVMVDNYVGESTQKEISYAAAQGIEIQFRNFPTAIGNTGATINQPKASEDVQLINTGNGKVFANGVEVDPETMKPVRQAMHLDSLPPFDPFEDETL
jgi:hypothetical protein